MAIFDNTPSRFGQINGGGAADAIFLKRFGGEVLTAFARVNIMEALHTIKSIDSGKSAAFPASWRATASYHTPGAVMLGANGVTFAERIINIDDLLVSNAFIANIDELKSHYDASSIHSKEMGEAIARLYDQQLLQLAVLAARASATVTGGNGGSSLVNANFTVSGAALAAGLYSAAETLDGKDIVDTENRHAVFRPAQFYKLVQETANINRDYGGMGSFSDGTITKVANIQIHKSNNLPITDMSGASTTGQNNTYVADFSNVAGVVFTPEAVGTVKLQGLKMESDYKVESQGTLLVASMAVGHGILRPECAVELKTA